MIGVPLSRTRLSVGVDPRDALSGGVIAGKLLAALENPTKKSDRRGAAFPLLSLPRHPGGGFSLAYPTPPAGAAKQLVLRLFDAAQRTVPRRLRLDVSTLVAAPPVDHETAAPFITLAPTLYPGVMAPIGSRATGVRGRVFTAPERGAAWARIVITVDADPAFTITAHCDQDGHFVVILPSFIAAEDMPTSLSIGAVPWIPPQLPDATPNDGTDPLRTLPIEDAFGPKAADVIRGTSIPSGYASAPPQSLDVPLGTMKSMSIKL